MSDRSKERRRRTLQRLGGPEVRPGRKVRLGDGWYRLRRGKLVRIPDKWLGKPAELVDAFGRRWERYKRPRPSTMTRKQRMRGDGWFRPTTGRVPRDKRRGHGFFGGGPKKEGHPRNRAPRHEGKRIRRMHEWDDE